MSVKMQFENVKLYSVEELGKTLPISLLILAALINWPLLCLTVLLLNLNGLFVKSVAMLMLIVFVPQLSNAHSSKSTFDV